MHGLFSYFFPNVLYRVQFRAVGRLRYESWQNDKGEKRSKISVVAERVQFLGSGQRAGGQEFREGGPAPERAERAPVEAPVDDVAPEAPAAGKEKDDIPF